MFPVAVVHLNNRLLASSITESFDSTPLSFLLSFVVFVMTTPDVLRGNDIQRLMQVVRGIQRSGTSYVSVRYALVFLVMFVQSDGFDDGDTSDDDANPDDGATNSDNVTTNTTDASSLLLLKVAMNLHATAVLHSVSLSLLTHLATTPGLRDRRLRVSQVTPSQSRHESGAPHAPSCRRQRVSSSHPTHSQPAVDRKQPNAATLREAAAPSRMHAAYPVQHQLQTFVCRLRAL